MVLSAHSPGALGLDEARLAAFVAQQHRPAGRRIRLEVHPLRGGLEATAVARVRAHFYDVAGRAHTSTFVVKRLVDAAQREAAIYQEGLAALGADAAPHLLGVETVAPTVSYLYLEYIPPSQVWPWRDTALSSLVLGRLADLHTSLPIGLFSCPPIVWDYEAELGQSAEATLALYEQVIRHDELASLRAVRGALRRTVAALGAMRQQLCAAEPFRVAALHGDVHSGNVIIRTTSGTGRAVLLDWGRARVGSPLEDVSAWLQSLGYWEPEARRRHDTLLQYYLAARGVSTHLGRELRDAYWLASACNVLSGALRYYLSLADGWGAASSHARADAARAARDHLRVIRRADAVWRR